MQLRFPTYIPRKILLALALAVACRPGNGADLRAQSLPAQSAGSASPAHSPAGEGFAGDRACRDCHRDKFGSYLQTAHHLTSTLPDHQTIAGSFLPGKNVMETFNPELSFLMTADNGNFYEIARRQKHGKTSEEKEPIDIVVGSASKGQTFLYWKQDELFELPVSYWTSLKRWVNSPGYVDGSADFSRPVTPRCMECHATYFQSVGSPSTHNRYNRQNFVLGISCERCHGPGQQHIEDEAAKRNPGASRLPPTGLDRARQIDICAQCHAGVGLAVAPAFSFRPGDDLKNFIVIPPQPGLDKVDVHGNQVALLEKSRCFQSSPTLTCSTCHDVHAKEKPAASYSDRCLACHQPRQCGEVRRRGSAAAANCIDCHMPVQDSNLLTVDTEEARLPARVRNHWIRVYRSN